MGKFTRSEMLYNDGLHYKWTAGADHDNPRYTAGTDHALLNRTEGYEVLYFINHFADRYVGSTTQEVYHKIETMIRYHVPSNLRSRQHVSDWLVANWNNV